MHAQPLCRPPRSSRPAQVLAASVVEDEVRKKLGLTTLDIDASRRLLAAYYSPEAQGKAERLMDIVQAVNKARAARLAAALAAL